MDNTGTKHLKISSKTNPMNYPPGVKGQDFKETKEVCEDCEWEDTPARECEVWSDPFDSETKKTKTLCESCIDQRREDFQRVI